ncbi:DUF427 domain-containing protein [Microbacterium aquimaris]|uniref:DUF427 domain-containing protein n=1 Tax=Microbacterium aquimaris TaxID=459816 RepID=A0ABU5N6X1_9MICO|nr:DUF427 domain-containing protein [Microbacterium aquimaris]MAP64484.1 hypothetical protein [Microbacterium sp.]MDZ8161796.1 DUF427 domain-containing protein [Microbacterium aquimaris]MDZ8277070.1 DUF427 domain-containing protein [Microbacterium aquimaris]|tara:strand:- start:52 stop:351 length:300 start_codon:yes stop_codon:yes gene_type:complete
MKARLNGVVIAEAEESDLVRIEGNWYWPPVSVADGVLSPSPTAYTCPWKGPARYHHVTAAGETLHDGAWAYPDLRPGAVERVGTDFAGYIAFDRSIEIS